MIVSNMVSISSTYPLLIAWSVSVGVPLVVIVPVVVIFPDAVIELQIKGVKVVISFCFKSILSCKSDIEVANPFIFTISNPASCIISCFPSKAVSTYPLFIE